MAAARSRPAGPALLEACDGLDDPAAPTARHALDDPALLEARRTSGRVAIEATGRRARRNARAYFAVQAACGALWWITVLAVERVRVATLGQWDPTLLIGPDLVLFVGCSALAAATGSRLAAVVLTGWTITLTLALAAYGIVERQAGWGVVTMAVAAVATLAATSTLWSGRLPTAWFFVGPFSFRVADEGPGAHHLRRSLVQLVVFWSIFFLALPLVLAATEARLRVAWPGLDHAGAQLLGAAMFLLGGAVGFTACVTMARLGRGTPLPAATARHLVVAGPYRHVRNPMAVAGMFQAAGVGLVLGSWLVVVLAAAGGVVWNQLIRPAEEADLTARFGAPYLRYTEQVRCWIPRWRS